jgi:hypothetical protein
MIKLTRAQDGKVIKGEKFKFIEWNADGSFSSSHDEPSEGRSLIIDPHFLSFTWMTTQILSFEKCEGVLKFRTLNSDYLLESDE